MKKLAFLFVVMLQALVVMADDSGKCGEKLTWTYTGSTQTLSIKGSGAMINFSDTSRAPWYSYRSAIKTVIIGNRVTSIGDYAFYDCTDLTSITIPNSVTSIGRSAFSDCRFLPSVTIPNRVTSIGDGAFGGCFAFTSITIPNSVKSLGDGAFSNCSRLTSVTIPSSVTSISNYAFLMCSALTSIIIPNSVTSIGNSAFCGCSGLVSITIGSGVTNIGKSAFSGCYALQHVYCKAEQVPSTTDYEFRGVKKTTATLHVPANSLSLYKTTVPWSYFGTIVAY